MSVGILGTKIVTSAEAWFSVALRPQKPQGSLGRKAQNGHLDFHTAPELCHLGIMLFLCETFPHMNYESCELSAFINTRIFYK